MIGTAFCGWAGLMVGVWAEDWPGLCIREHCSKCLSPDFFFFLAALPSSPAANPSLRRNWPAGQAIKKLRAQMLPDPQALF